MPKPRALISVYDGAQRALLRRRIRATERRIRRFDQLTARERERFLISRRKVLDARSIEHVSRSTLPEAQIQRTGDLYLTVLRDAVVDVRFGFALTPTGLLLEETATNRHVIDRHLVTGKLLRPTKTVEVHRPTMCLECGPNKANFFHFWFQSMTKLLWAREPEVEALGPAYLAHTRTLQPWQVTLLRAALPDNVDLLQVDNATWIHAPYYVDLPPYSGTALDADARRAVSSWASVVERETATESPLPSRFYISRRGGKVRHALNEDEVEDALRPRGISTVVLEDLTMGDQIRLFAGAEIIVAQHGAGLTNLLHAKPGTRLLEVFSGSPETTRLQYRGISAVSGIAYSNLFCGAPHDNDDVVLPVADIADWVDRSLGDR